MEELSIILLLLSIGLYVVRYVVRKKGVDFLTVIVSICGMCAVMNDPTILGGKDFLIALFPVLFVMMMSLCALAFDPTERRF